MASHPLDYRSPDSPRAPRVLPWRILIALAVLASGAFALMMLPSRRVECHIDEVTGSMSRETAWFGIRLRPEVETSAIEKRLRDSGAKRTPSWRLLYRTRHNILSMATSRESGPTPLIFRVRSLLDQFAAASTDKELAAFVRVMESGTAAEQEAAVDAAGEKGLKWMERAGRNE